MAGKLGIQMAQEVDMESVNLRGCYRGHPPSLKGKTRTGFPTLETQRLFGRGLGTGNGGSVLRLPG